MIIATLVASLMMGLHIAFHYQEKMVLQVPELRPVGHCKEKLLYYLFIHKDLNCTTFRPCNKIHVLARNLSFLFSSICSFFFFSFSSSSKTTLFLSCQIIQRGAELPSKISFASCLQKNQANLEASL